ncbi:MAG: hypothetical protein IKO93_00325 [Lentisphaeria bacterium]|nr:hypothetical protein [Lentisphaeria bacterium]
MSNTVENTVESIKLLIAGGDLSDSVHLRQLHKACLLAFKELNTNLEQCRTLIENGSIQAARELNLSFDPPLTREAELLAYFKTNDFFAVCKEYGLETPVFPDEQLLGQLIAPISTGEKCLHALFQDYRKIARNGSMLQRITLLRQIVQKLPKSPRWRNDLISAEHSRCQEIEHELEEIDGDSDCCSRLEELCREVMTPDWLIPPKEELKSAIRQKLLPLQQARLNKEIESRLAQLQECYQARDIDRLEKEFEKWKTFCSSPVVNLSDEQRQTAADIESFLEQEAETRRNDQICQELIRKIEQKLAENALFSEVAGDYNQLQLMDNPIPAALDDRLKALEEEYNRLEHLRHVRWCIYGICGAVLLTIAIGFSIWYMQHYLAVKRNLVNMRDLLDNRKYDEVIKIYGGLEAASSKVAADPQIIRIHTAARQKKEEMISHQKKKNEEFKRLLQQIERLAGTDILDNARQLDLAMSEAAKLKDKELLSKESLDQFTRLVTKVIQKRTELKKQRETEFLAFCRKKYGEVEELIKQIRDPQKELNDLKTLLAVSQNDFDEKLKSSRYSYIIPAMKDEEKKKFQSAKERFEQTWENENAFRRVNSPVTFDDFIRDLEKIRYKHPDLATRYSLPLRLCKHWMDERDNYEKTFPEKLEGYPDNNGFSDGLFKTDLGVFRPKMERSKNFDQFFQDIQTDKDLKEIIFAGADGRPFYFYFHEKDGLIEYLRHPRRINIIFVPLPAGNEKNSRFVISFNEKNPEMPYLIKTRHPNLPYELPKGFISLNGRQNPPLPKDGLPFWPGHVLSSKYNALNGDGPGLISNLKGALRFICQKGNVENSYLKKTLLLQFLQELYDASPLLYPELSDALAELKDTPARNWRAPQAAADYGEEKKQFERKWTLENLNRLLAAGEFRDRFICKAHARLLVPVGVIQEAEQNQVKIHLFKDCKIPVEGLVLENNAVFVLPKKVWQGEIPRDDKWKKRLFPGQVIWCYGDDQSTGEFLRKWQEEAQRLNIELKIKPSVLPADQVL